MRLLQLVTRPGELLDLHPQVTVVQGLDPEARDRLVGSVAGLARGWCEGEGLLEAHGVLFDLDPALLSLLDLRTSDVDPVVRPSDLPAQPLTVDARELRAREQGFAELLSQIAAQVERHAQATAGLEAAADAVTRARTARADADAAIGDGRVQIQEQAAQVTELERALAALKIERAQADAVHEDARQVRAQVEDRTEASRAPVRELASRRGELEEQVRTLTAELEPTSAAVAAAAAAALHDLEAASPAPRDIATPDLDAAGPHADGAARLDAAERRLAFLEHVLAALHADGTDAVRAALVALTGAQEGELVPSSDALALADELEALGEEIAADAEIGAEDLTAEETGTARARLDAARSAEAEAEDAVRHRELDPAAAAELDANHEALLEAMERSEGRFGGGRARARLEELRATEDALLTRLGLISYAERLMGPTASRRDPAKEAELEAAQRELAAAEEAWHEVERRTDAALARAARLDRRRRLREQAAALLGDQWRGPDSAEADLRALRVPRVGVDERAGDLRDALDQVGIDVADDLLEAADLALVAEAWLAEADQVEARAAAHRAEHGALLAEVEALRRDPATDPLSSVASLSDPNELSPQQAHDRAVAEAQAAMDAAQDRLAAHERAAARLAELEAELAALEVELAAAESVAAEAEAEVAAALDAERSADDRRAELDEQLTRAEEALAAALGAQHALIDARPDLDALDASIEQAELHHRDAIASVERASAALASLDEEGQAAASEIERLQDIVAAQGAGTVTEASELEWYLLARVASQRNVSVAGSLPLVLDDALRGLDPLDVAHLLDRLERMAETVQVIVVSDDPAVGAWAEEAGAARAAVVMPVPI